MSDALVETQDLSAIFASQREFYSSGFTRSVRYRRAVLDLLDSAFKAWEERIIEALKKDLGKSLAESWITEISLVRQELRWARRHIGRLSRRRRVFLPLNFAISRSTVEPVPFGVSLIIAPWNYPIQLSLLPLISAIAAGNTAILKPSEAAPASAEVLRAMLAEYFTSEYIAVLPGGPEISQSLLDERPDMIFFTGSTRVGKIIAEKAAKTLIPTVLELGGKSPCLVLQDADVEMAARRIVWGKFVNCGQTCIAPDFVLVHESLREAFVENVIRFIIAFYAPGTAADASASQILSAIRGSPDYGRIINQRHFQRLKSYLDSGSLRFGGDTDESALYFSPSILEGVSWNSPVMSEEIFGPILPILGFEEEDQAYAEIESRPHPLAFYLFTRDTKEARRVMSRANFGGGCVNDTLLHSGSHKLPFGGVGDSGMGAYHGRAGFAAFSRQRSVVFRSTSFDPGLRYPPYAEKVATLKRLVR